MGGQRGSEFIIREAYLFIKLMTALASFRCPHSLKHSNKTPKHWADTLENTFKVRYIKVSGALLNASFMNEVTKLRGLKCLG
jgi:hypothetical protein